MQRVYNKRSDEIIDGKAKLPTAEQLEYGELAINYAKGKETISIKNSDDEIVTLPFGNVSKAGLIKFERAYQEEPLYVFEDINDFYDSVRNKIGDGEQLYEPEDGKICVAELADGTYIPIISPEPSYDSIVDPNKKKTNYEIMNHKHRPYDGNRIVVRKQLSIRPVEHLPYYFQDGIVTIRINKNYLKKGESIAIYVYDRWFEEPRFVKDGYGSIYGTSHSNDIQLINHGDGLWELKNNGNRDLYKPIVIQIPFKRDTLGIQYNVLEVTNSSLFVDVDTRDLFSRTIAYNFGQNCVKVGNIRYNKYYNRETLSPYLKFVRTEGCNIKLINTKPSLWKGVVDHDGEVIYENTSKYSDLMGMILDKAPNTFIKSKTRDYIYRYHKKLAQYRKDAGYGQGGVVGNIEGGYLYLRFSSITDDVRKCRFVIHFDSKIGFSKRSVDLSFQEIENLIVESYNLPGNGKVFKLLFDGDDFYDLGQSFYGWEVSGIHVYCRDSSVTHMPILGDRDKKMDMSNKKLNPFGWFKGGYSGVSKSGRNTYEKIRRNKGRYQRSYAIKLYKVHRGIPSSYPTTVIIRKNKRK